MNSLIWGAGRLSRFRSESLICQPFEATADTPDNKPSLFDSLQARYLVAGDSELSGADVANRRDFTDKGGE
jgi:hypothetical protein